MVVKVVESNPSSAESCFRKIDDVFLQRQTKIWLSEVLHVIFKADACIADLLMDGELLFELSKVMRKKLMSHSMEANNPKVMIYERTSYAKNKERYLAYLKIDSFLKICQILGLTSVDLFSPSDVVEKRNTRGVCLCIRSLSKKARLKGLNVPDFQIVTYTIAMPKDKVGYICRNLEQSQISHASSDLACRYFHGKQIHRQQSTVDGDGYLQEIEGDILRNDFEWEGETHSCLQERMVLSDVKSDSEDELSWGTSSSPSMSCISEDDQSMISDRGFLHAEASDESCISELESIDGGSECSSTVCSLVSGEETSAKYPSAVADLLAEDYVVEGHATNNCSSHCVISRGLEEISCSPHSNYVDREPEVESHPINVCDMQKAQDRVYIDDRSIVDHGLENGDKGIERHEEVDVEVPRMKEQEQKTNDLRDKRPGRMFLKAITSGIVVVGGLFLLHFSRRNGGSRRCRAT